jgi:hypothetical protein
MVANPRQSKAKLFGSGALCKLKDPVQFSEKLTLTDILE